MCDLGFKREEKLERVRNFYGMLSVTEDYDSGLDMKYRQLSNGGIIHGMQNFGDSLREEPTTYYGRHTGIGKALDSLKDRLTPMSASSAWARAPSPATPKAATASASTTSIPMSSASRKKHFTYLEDAQKARRQAGDRHRRCTTRLERESDQQFDVLLLDAFSGDSVPVHLLTREAFAIYQRHMKPDGIIAVHITNTYLVLAPVIEKIAADSGFKTTRIATEAEGDHDSTDYILVTHNEPFLKDHAAQPARQRDRTEARRPPLDRPLPQPPAHSRHPMQNT
jgi:hypothetical protein